jgi:hypothetical protein
MATHAARTQAAYCDEEACGRILAGLRQHSGSLLAVFACEEVDLSQERLLRRVRLRCWLSDATLKPRPCAKFGHHHKSRAPASRTWDQRYEASRRVSGKT